MADTIKIAIYNDEKNIRSYLVSLIKKQGGECSITEYVSADAYLLDSKGYDIIFLDIEMGGPEVGLDGIAKESVEANLRKYGRSLSPVDMKV